MRIYNPFKKIRQLESELTRVREELNNEQQKNQGKHMTGVWCEECKHGIIRTYDGMYGKYTERTCRLDCPCDDINKKD